MVSYIIRRLIIMIPVLIGITMVSFVMVHLVPGNPAEIMAGVGASAQDIHNIELQLGLDKPLWYQYLEFLGRIAHGDLGTSVNTQLPVTMEIKQTLPVTATLALCSTILSVVLGLSAGIISGVRKGGVSDSAATVISLFDLSMPSFWLGLMMIFVFSGRLRWLPAAGWNGISSIILPSITLGAATIAIVARMMRSSLIDVLSSDYIRTARAKGLKRIRIIWHALRNALIPSITVIGIEFGTLLGGAVITENVFAIPGMGRLIVNAITARDYPTIQGGVLVIGFIFVLVNLVTDLAYAFVDPRIKY